MSLFRKENRHQLSDYVMNKHAALLAYVLAKFYMFRSDLQQFAYTGHISLDISENIIWQYCKLIGKLFNDTVQQTLPINYSIYYAGR